MTRRFAPAPNYRGGHSLHLVNGCHENIGRFFL
jgi:hypothetical protein